MNFNDFAKSISKIENIELPGSASHYKMIPSFRRKELEANGIVNKNTKKAAVMALFYPDISYNTNLLLILRNTYKGIHSNQIALPGGKVEKEDESLLATALRETYEEVGADPNNIRVIRHLTEIFIPPSNFEVTPYLGLYQKERPFLLQKEEVAALVEVSLYDFMDDSKIIYQKLSTSYADNVEVPAFKLNGYTVWGATAMMLNEIKELFKQVL
ncbi:NUDIX hydrolase [Arenibacter certesii]|uniref:Coenzyme A pyrophosphatase n=1 Tax=Arenibacter certesii TaxID=228955 RepID=A0A918MJV6_9FLAO|nr:CoA pyrophosphatase [Arenibacter certesii]GGW33250.1 coenzyme A pyrophosphatase [Arenibacter certesii]